MEKEKLVIRKLQEKDIPHIVDIQITGWQTAYKGIIDDAILISMDKTKRIERIKQHYKETDFIVAELSDEVVGFCNYIDSPKYTPDISDIDCELLALYIKPDLKYNGIGTQLFHFVINDFKRKNKTKMILWCLKDNIPSIKFYSKMGGEIIKDRIINMGNHIYCEVGFGYNL